MAVLAYLLCLKKICEKICSKEYCFVEQGLCKLETKETKVAKTGFNPIIVETVNTLKMESPVFKTYQLPLTNLFTFNLFFLTA